MRKVKFLWVFTLLVVPILVLSSGLALAQGPVDGADGEKPPPTRETTRQQVIDTEMGPRFATVVESVTDYSVPVISQSQDKAFQPDSVHYVGSVIVTCWRELSFWPEGDLYWAMTRARTTTDQCVDQVNVWAAHQLKIGSAWVDQFNSGNYKSEGDCHDDSGIAPTTAALYVPDQWHRSRGVHVVYVSQRYEWDETGPTRKIP